MHAESGLMTGRKNMDRLRKVLMAVILAGFVGAGVLCPPAAARDFELALHPQKAPAEVGKFSLLPPEGSLIDEDAVPLYEKAIKALPDKPGNDQIREWLKMPIDQLPLDQVEQVLQQHMESLKSVAKAAKCRQCNWPEREPGAAMADRSACRRLGSVVRLWARLEIADDGYEGAILAMQTGFGMARHVGQAPTILQMMTAIGIGAGTCAEVEEFVQREEAPNLNLALAVLPRPFMDIEKVIEEDRKRALAEWQGKLSNDQIESELKKTHDQIRLLAKGFDAQLAALQCVEAIRAYAAVHGGQLPTALTDITEGSVPQDPMSGEPFRYSRTGSTAVLESFVPPGVSERRGTRYEVSIKN